MLWNTENVSTETGGDALGSPVMAWHKSLARSWHQLAVYAPFLSPFVLPYAGKGLADPSKTFRDSRHRHPSPA